MRALLSSVTKLSQMTVRNIKSSSCRSLVRQASDELIAGNVVSTSREESREPENIVLCKTESERGKAGKRRSIFFAHM